MVIYFIRPKLTFDGTSAEKEAPKTQIRCVFLYAAMFKPDLVQLTMILCRCSEVSRLLKSGGVFMLITYGSPKTHLPYLEPRKYQWEVSKFTVGEYSLFEILLLQICESGAEHILSSPIDKPTVNFEDKEQREKDVHYVYCCKKR